MAEEADTKLDAQVQHKVPASQKPGINKEAAEEAKKAGASESKHDENIISSSAVDLKMDKLDELSSLEQEIAKMHNIHTESHPTDTAGHLISGPPNNTAVNGGDAQLVSELAQTKRNTPANVPLAQEPASDAPLADVDLIALLKGNDQEQDMPAEQKTNIELELAELDNVGVTIEGEGQYEIMEIDDGDHMTVSSPDPLANAKKSPPKSPLRTGPKYAVTLGKPKLSPEQARAVALEQMADLKAHKRRVAKQQQQHSDIISALNDDWNDYDSSSDNASNFNALASPTVKKLLPKKSKALDPTQFTSNVRVLLKSTSPKSLDKVKAATEQVDYSAETTGFKRTRVIKPKIIWDPDAPESQKSFAQYASTKGATAAITNTAATTTVTIAAAAATKSNNLDALPKKTRPATPKDPLKVAAKRAATPSKQMETRAITPTKRRSQTPSMPNGAGGSQAKKKKITEIDRLMGDEGAANMMQAVEREQRELSGGEPANNNKPLMRKRAFTLAGQSSKAANAVEVRATTPKKDSPSAKGNKRGSTTTAAAEAAATSTADVDAVFAKTSKPRLSAAWDYVYKQRASEESMIMRRRSNSSYSSNASVNRLSLDANPAALGSATDESNDAPAHAASAAAASDPTFKFLKPETKTNQRTDAEAPQTLANDLKRGTAQQKDSKTSKDELVTLHKLDKVTQLMIHVPLSKAGYSYNLQLLQKLTELLNKLAKSNDCNTLLLTVQGTQFCQGIDCQELIGTTLEKRKNHANQFALVLKTYLRSLATFHKPLVAGIVGSLKNLGLMQLPLFDYVVAADNCTFQSNYAKLGQLPEGYTLWHKHPKVSSQVHSRLFLLGDKLNTSELTAPISFIDKTCEESCVHDEALAVAQLISSTTAEHYRTLKKLNHSGNTGLLQRLETEFKILTDLWSSAGFQANCKRYLNEVDI